MPTRIIMRPYLTEIIVVFAAGYVIGHYTAKGVPTIAEVKQTIAENPEAAAEVVQKREPFIQYGDGRITLNIGKAKR